MRYTSLRELEQYAIYRLNREYQERIGRFNIAQYERLYQERIEQGFIYRPPPETTANGKN